MRFVVVFMIPFVLACGHGDLSSMPTPGSTPASASAPAPILPPAEVTDPCVPETGPATESWRAFRMDLLAMAAKDSRAFQASLPTHLTAFRQQHRTELADHAAWIFRRIPKVILPDLDSLPNDPRATTEVAARIQGILADPSFLDLLSTDPVSAFAGIRGVVMAARGPENLDGIRDNILEGFAPPLLVRLNEDVAHPVLGMQKNTDLFVVEFANKDGTFVPQRIRWLRQNPPIEPGPIKTPEHAFLAFANAVEAIPPEEGDTVANLSTRLLAKVNQVAETWLNPRAPLLRRHGVCVSKQLPRGPRPDLTRWKEDTGMWNTASLAPLFPRLKWNPLQAFLFLRTTILSRTLNVGDYANLSLIDGLVSPAITRVNDDAENPVLSLVEGTTALWVEFSSTPDRGFFPTAVRYLRRE